MGSFKNNHPVVVMVYFASILLMAMFLWNPLIQGISLLGGFAFFMALYSKKEVLTNLFFYMGLFLLVTLTNPIFSHQGVTPLFFMNGNPVTREAFLYGGAIAMLIISVMVWFKSYEKIMTSDKFLYLFGRVLPKVSLIVSMALGFVPSFRREMDKVGKTQKAMGLYENESYADKLKGKISVMSVMVSWSLEHAVEKSHAMKARGYGLKGRTHYSIFTFTAQDGFLISFCLLLLGITLFGAARGVTTFNYYPKVSSLSSTLLAQVTYLSFALMAFLPVIIEVEENLKWTYYVSKI